MFLFTICLDARGQRRRSYETTLKANRRTAEYRMSNVEGWVRFAQSFFYNNNDRIPYFDIHYSLFDIRYSLFQSFFLIKLAVFLASGGARIKLAAFQAGGYARFLAWNFF
jgi:hypothetical protein